MLRALIESASRFRDKMSPLGYMERPIKWVIDIDQNTGKHNLLGPYQKNDKLLKAVPVRGDRAGQISEENLKAALIVDKATYALGIAEPGKEKVTKLAHKGFKDLIQKAYNETGDTELELILNFLQKPLPPEFLEKNEHGKKVNIRPNDRVAFRSNPQEFPFERKYIQEFWSKYLRNEYSQSEAYCAICGNYGPVLRILPWEISFSGYGCPLSSFNQESFESFGKKQTENSPLCFNCAGKASQVLQYLVNPGRHSVILAKDEAKGVGKYPLKNQLAVFWLKEKALVKIPQTELIIDIEECIKSPLALNDSDSVEGPPPEIDQLKRLLNLPWLANKQAFNISGNCFYLAVLSPNKSRLIVREWIEESLESVLQNLKKYIQALSIIHPNGLRICSPPLPLILEALKPEKSKTAVPNSNLLRGLLRTAYSGNAPPHGLIETAVGYFRIPDKPATNKKEEGIQNLRRMALAASIKLVLTHRKKEAKTMEQCDDKHMTQPYLCGRLLSVLEELQMQAAWPGKLNTTLVDRFYGTASTAPDSVFGNLIKTATAYHLPKLRKANRGYSKMKHLLEDIMSKIVEAGHFPKPLMLRDQAEFALGFYHQSAEFRKERPHIKKEDISFGKITEGDLT
ncbi:MAG TPA: type I-C CRISPR-associated protein Cas8c/Csd1 [archaeon]|nr:type I-C CRISPR-associated protein Cas8c/Csd1 [archaeon]